MTNEPAAGERGAAAVEFVILVPVLVLLIGVIVAGARLAHARATVQQVADSAARSASLARDAASADAFARRVAGLDVASAHLACAGGVGVTVDTSGFAVPVGQRVMFVVDLWEHAYWSDFGPKGRAKYFDSVIQDTDWSVIERRFALTLK